MELNKEEIRGVIVPCIYNASARKKFHILMAGDKPDDNPGHKRAVTPDLDQRLKAKINSTSSPVGSSKDLLIAEDEQAPHDTVIPDFEHKMSDSTRNYCLKLLDGDLSSKTLKEGYEIMLRIHLALLRYPKALEVFKGVALKYLGTRGKRILTNENLAPADVRRLNKDHQNRFGESG